MTSRQFILSHRSVDWPLGPVAFAMSSTVDINTPYAVDQDMTPSEVAKLYAARNRSSIQIREAYKIKKWGYPLPNFFFKNLGTKYIPI